MYERKSLNARTERYREFIRNVLHQYYPVDEASVSLLLEVAKFKTLEKGELLLAAGKTAKEIYLLYEGLVVSYFTDEKGNTYHKNIFLEGNFVGSLVSALTSQPSHFALEVVERSTLITFNFERYRKLIKESAVLSNFHISYLEKNWVIDKEKREVDIVLKEAKERYLNFVDAHPNIESRIPLHYIASHLGITPTQLSRIRKKIKEKSSNQHM